MSRIIDEAFDADICLANIENEIYETELDEVLDEDMNFLSESWNDFEVTEGANIDALKEHINAYKDFFTYTKAARRDLKNKNYKDAKVNINKAKASINESMEAIKKSESDVVSVVFALFTGGIPRMARSLGILATGLVSGIGLGAVMTPITKTAADAYVNAYSDLEKMIFGIKSISTKEALAGSMIGASAVTVQISNWCNTIIKLIEEIIGIVNNIKAKNKANKDITVDDFNIYKIHTLNALKELAKSCDKFEKKIDEKAKLDNTISSAKKAEVKKESEDTSADVSDFILKCIEFTMDFDPDNTNYVVEGFNLDMGNEHMAAIKEIRSALRDVKKDIKKKDYDSAKKSLDTMKDKVDSQIDYLKKYEGGVTESIFGSIFLSFTTIVTTFVATIVTLPIGGIGAIIPQLESLYNTVYGTYKKFYDKYKKKEEITADDFNAYKNYILGKYESLKGIIRGLDNKIDALKKNEKEKKAEETKESVADKFNEEKLKLYEACSAGEITEDQRELLLYRFSLTSKVEESVINNDVTEEKFSNKDGFDVVKKDIYERCANGEFDVDTREDLIKEAYARFFEGEDSIDKIVKSAKSSNNEADNKKLEQDVKDCCK